MCVHMLVLLCIHLHKIQREALNLQDQQKLNLRGITSPVKIEQANLDEECARTQTSISVRWYFGLRQWICTAVVLH